MAAPNPKRQKKAQETLNGLFADTSNVQVIHYSCESFYDRPEGRTPRITSIAVRQIDSGQTTSFSIHQVAERQQIPFNVISKRYDELELQMLKEYFDYIGTRQGMKYLHWNMRDVNYGFAAIEHRFSVLGGEPNVVDNRNKFDLARLLIDIYGSGYIGHPRFQKLMEKNSMQAPHFMTGEEEAKAFENCDYVGLHQSTLRKVDLLANFAVRAHDQSLKVDTTLLEMRGGRFRLALAWAINHWIIAGIGTIVSIFGGLLAIREYFWH